MADKKENMNKQKITDKIIIERKYKNEITPIQAILPMIIEEIERKQKEQSEN